MGVLNMAPMELVSDSLPILRIAGTPKDQATTESASSATTALPTGGSYVRLLATEAMYISVAKGTPADAAAGMFMLPAGIPEYLKMDDLVNIKARDVA